MNFPGQNNNNNVPSILSSIFCLPSWNCVSLKGITHHPSGWNCCSSRCSYSLTYIDIQISSCEISNITLTLVYWFLYLLLLLKEEWDVQPEPHISQMWSGEVAVTQQASQLTTKLVMGDMSGSWPLQDAVRSLFCPHPLYLKAGSEESMKNTCDVTLTLKGFSFKAASFIFLNMLRSFMYVYIYNFFFAEHG